MYNYSKSSLITLMDNEGISVKILSSKERDQTTIRISGLSPLMAQIIASMSLDKHSELNKKIAEILQRDVHIPLRVKLGDKEV